MPAQPNHTNVAAHDPRESAEFLSEILGLPAPALYGPFLITEGDVGAATRARLGRGRRR